MRFRNFMKGYGGYQLYKHSTGYYDHYNPKDDTGDEDATGCFLTILLFASIYIGTKWGGTAVKVFLGSIVGIWFCLKCYIKYSDYEDSKDAERLLQRRPRQSEFEAQRDIAYTNRVQHYKDIGRFDLANQEIERHMQEKYGRKK